ncbi:MAG: sensor histidine kinase [Adhaeribacter sp.]
MFIAVIYFITRFYYVQLSEEHARDKINFFINIAHEIRTPLSLIRSPLSLAIRKNDFSPQTLKTLKTADQNAERLSALIHQLLEFEKAENNQAPLKLHPVNMEDHITALCAGFTPFLEEKNITLVKKFEQNNTCLLADQDKLDKIISNLLSNAIKYTPANGRVEISTYCLFNNYLIQVSDTGQGIPADQQKYLFKRHFRAKTALNSNEPGSGIGLMLTQKLVKLHKRIDKLRKHRGQGQHVQGFASPYAPFSPGNETCFPRRSKTCSCFACSTKKTAQKK